MQTPDVPTGAGSAPPALEALRARVAADHRRDEPGAVTPLLAEAQMASPSMRAAQDVARHLAEGVRAERHKAGGVDALMLEFSRDSREGIALMCLAEALLRIPDAATRDLLIRDKPSQGAWHAHVGRSPSLFGNAAAWGLLVTGRLVDSRSDNALEQALGSLLRKGGVPLIRKGVDLAMRLLGRQFVLGRTIEEALGNARERQACGYRFSFDMLGETALAGDDAQRERVATIAAAETDPLAQARLATGLASIAIVTPGVAGKRVRGAIGARCEVAADPLAAGPDAVQFAGDSSAAAALRHTLTDHDGPLVPLVVVREGTYDAARRMVERTVTINTTASGGNATLLSLEEAERA